MSSTKDVIQSVNDGVKEFDRAVGSPVLSYNSKYEYYLNLSEPEMRALDKEDVNEASYCLLQYSLYLIKKINGHKSKIIVNKRLLGRMVEKERSNFSKFLKSEELINALVVSNTRAEAIDNEILKSLVIIQEYEGVIDRISEIARVYRNMGFTK